MFYIISVIRKYKNNNNNNDKLEDKYNTTKPTVSHCFHRLQY